MFYLPFAEEGRGRAAPTADKSSGQRAAEATLAAATSGTEGSSFQLGGKRGGTTGRVAGTKLCLIRWRPEVPITSGCATRAYFEISQNRFWTSIGCSGRP